MLQSAEPSAVNAEPSAVNREVSYASRPAESAGHRFSSMPVCGDWRSRFFAPVDNASLCIFRIGFGLMMTAWAGEYLFSGRVGYLYVQPKFHFTYYLFDWVRPWPGVGMHLHFVALLALTLCIAVGLRYRMASTLFAMGFTYFFLLERTNYQNHYYLLMIVSWVMTLLPAHRSFSLDARRCPDIRSSTAPAWTLWLLRFHIALPYFFGGVAKLDADWLAGEPMRQYLAAHARWPVIGPLFHEQSTVTFFVWGGLFFDLTIVPLLLWNRSRGVAYALCVFFHVMNSLLFSIHVFPWFMIFATTIFFEPDWPRRCLRWLREPVAGAPQPGSEPAPSAVAASANSTSPVDVSWSLLSRRAKFGVVTLAVYCLFHLVWPFRHHLYPGNTSWTERGHLFSWRMMLRGKTTGVRYYITDPETSQTWHPNLRPILNMDQVGKFARDPEIILDLARFLAKDHRRRTGRDVEVRALVLTSLNGRKPELLIDPAVDLAKEPRGFHFKTWIRPQTEPLRSKPWSVPLIEWERHVELPPLPFTPNRSDRSHT